MGKNKRRTAGGRRVDKQEKMEEQDWRRLKRKKNTERGERGIVREAGERNEGRGMDEIYNKGKTWVK